MVTGSFQFIILLGIAFLALFLSLIAFITARNLRDDVKRDSIKTIVRQEIGNNLDQRIKNIVQDELNKKLPTTTPNSKRDIAIDPPKIERTISVKKDNVPVQPEKKEPEQVIKTESKPEEKKEPTTEVSKPSNPVFWYTGSYKTGRFLHITPSPDEKTIFVITLASMDATVGDLDIDVNAYNKISQTPDFLEKACNLSGSGAHVKVISKGLVEKVNDAWVVKVPIVAELN